jgi:hypothetical protein
MHSHLGKIFISHTETDKPFVRTMANWIEKNGFGVWLDERSLLVGDPLAERISEALAAARVVLVIVSSASINSKWLRYELNLATERMVKGLCRVIPIVIDGGTPLPPEVRGLLYADCRDSLDDGWSSILTALQHESRRVALEHSFWKRAEVLVQEVFGTTGFASDHGEYKTRDYNLLYLPLEDVDGNEVVASYEVVSAYISEPRPLNEKWLDEYGDELDEFPDGFSLSLVVTERPTEFKLDAVHPLSARIGIRRYLYNSENVNLSYPCRQIVVADLSSLAGEAEQKNALQLAREMLLQCAEFEKSELLKVRKANAARQS